MKKLLFLTIISVFILLPYFIEAQDVLGHQKSFNLEPSYDLSERSQLTATLIRISPQLYWYIDDNWWEDLNSEEKTVVKQSLNALAEEFEDRIYPRLTQVFGSEWSPGIDRDTRITILIHPMQKEAGGYFNSADEYPKSQVPNSNEREMLYLNAKHINEVQAKSLLAHEFVHLITFNQKDKIYNVFEEVWLNEARAEYAPTLLGYDQEYEDSNLQKRVKNFLDKSSDSLTEWRNAPSDYGVLNLFTQYLVDHYGVKILADSLKMRKTGIESLNAVLSQRGFKEDFSQIFTNWAIAVLINDCSLSDKYCYFNSNLKNFRVTPLVNYLPFIGESTLSVVNTTKDWSGNWHKFIGGKGALKLEFKNDPGVNFKVPYLIQDSEGNYSVNFLELDSSRQDTVYVSGFGTENTSLTIIPLSQNKTSGFGDPEPSHSFFWSASTIEKTPEEEKAELIEKLLAQIEFLKKEIAKVQAQVQAILVKRGLISCQKFENDLYFGMVQNAEVSCLQEFLKSQGSEIYPEGLVTGNFLSLTKAAVIRFQEKYAEDILAPLGFSEGTGFVGSKTIAKINQLLAQ